MCVCMRGGTVDGMTEEKIEMDRAERKRMGELSKRAKQRQAGSVRQEAGNKRGRKSSRLDGDGMGMCYVPCLAWSSLCIPGGRAPRPRHLGLFQVVKA